MLFSNVLASSSWLLAAVVSAAPTANKAVNVSYSYKITTDEETLTSTFVLQSGSSTPSDPKKLCQRAFEAKLNSKSFKIKGDGVFGVIDSVHTSPVPYTFVKFDAKYGPGSNDEAILESCKVAELHYKTSVLYSIELSDLNRANFVPVSTENNVFEDKDQLCLKDFADQSFIGQFQCDSYGNLGEESTECAPVPAHRGKFLFSATVSVKDDKKPKVIACKATDY